MAFKLIAYSTPGFSVSTPHIFDESLDILFKYNPVKIITKKSYVKQFTHNLWFRCILWCCALDINSQQIIFHPVQNNSLYMWQAWMASCWNSVINVSVLFLYTPPPRAVIHFLGNWYSPVSELQLLEIHIERAFLFKENFLWPFSIRYNPYNVIVTLRNALLETLTVPILGSSTADGIHVTLQQTRWRLVQTADGFNKPLTAWTYRWRRT